MGLKETWKWRVMQRLYTEVTCGCTGIHSQADASYTAAILRLLADDLDPERKGDPRAPAFMAELKRLIRHDDEFGS